MNNMDVYSSMFSATISDLADTVCQVGAIEHGGIVCSYDKGLPSACKVVCDKGYGVNPLRVYRRVHDCQVPEDIDRLKRAMKTQRPCLSELYMKVVICI